MMYMIIYTHTYIANENAFSLTSDALDMTAISDEGCKMRSPIRMKCFQLLIGSRKGPDPGICQRRAGMV